MNNDENKPDSPGPLDEEQRLARLLRAVGKREDLPAHLSQSWEAGFRRELAQARSARRQRRWRQFAYSACLLVLVGVGLLLTLPGDNDPLPEVRVVSVHGNGVTLQAGAASAGAAAVGQGVTLPSTVATGSDGLLALRYGQYDVRLNHQTRLRLQRDKLELLAGEIYVSDFSGYSNNSKSKSNSTAASGSSGNNIASTSNSSSNPGTATGLLVTTPFGEVRDVGTQFTLGLEPERMVARVRRGAIVLAAGRNQYRADASDGGARQLVINQASEVRVTDIAPSGEPWQWIYQSGPQFVLEGNTAFGFLQWVAQESGLQLKFASDSAKVYAHTTMLHGDINGIDPLEALQPVLAATDLSAALVGQRQLQVTLLPRY